MTLIGYRFRWGGVSWVGIGPPQRACENIKVLNTYLTTGGNPSAYLGRTPLIMCAAETRSYKIVSKLINLGVDIDAQKKAIPFPIMSEDIGTTALYMAVQKGDMKITNLLLENGANINISKAAESPLNLTIVLNRPRLLSLFLKSENAVFEFDGGLIANAGYYDGSKIFRILFEADVHIESAYLSRALENAASRGNLQLVKFLFDEDAEVNKEPNSNVPSALHRSVEGNHLDVTIFLISVGADVNLADWNENTPLHNAAIFNHHEIAAILIENGANINLKNFKDKTPLEVAIEHSSLEVVDLLIKNE
ncbi:ankyrin repeat domain-containing protein [Leptothoe sp. ISB3NOV94-8A]